jgi:hypothetical protein
MCAHACRYGQTHVQALIATKCGNHERAEALWAAQHERGALQLHAMLDRLQGFYLKLGQLLAAKADVLPPVYTAALSPLLDDLPADSHRKVQRLLRRHLRQPVGDVRCLTLRVSQTIALVVTVALLDAQLLELFGGQRPENASSSTGISPGTD